MKAIGLFLALYFFPCLTMAEVNSGQNAATTLLMLLAVIALILGVAKVMKRMQLPAMGVKSGIKLIAQMPLGQKERILLLEVNDEQILVGVTSNQINLIKKLDHNIQPIVESNAIEKAS